MQRSELEFVEQSRARIVEQAKQAPLDVEAFLDWMTMLVAERVSQHASLFDWLAEHASFNDVRWLLRQEIASEAGFDDVLALAQVRLPAKPKLELARAYWDELGHGKSDSMRGLAMARLAAALDLDAEGAPVVWEALATSNLMIAIASHRRYAYHAIGAIVATTLPAASHAHAIDRGLERLGLSVHARRCFSERIGVSRDDWRGELVAPLAADPVFMQAIAEGALMRLDARRRCFDRYQLELGLASHPPRQGRVTAA